MDFIAFFDDVKSWMLTCNTVAQTYGMADDSFWSWVYNSVGQLTKKYNNEPFANMQMRLLVEWLESMEVSE